MKQTFKMIFGLGAVAALTGCTTVKMPNLDFLKLPEFRGDAVNVKDYPNVKDAPVAPTDVRSAKQWDDAAKDLIKIRDKTDVPVDVRENETDAEVLANIEELRLKAQAYKLDDPQ